MAESKVVSIRIPQELLNAIDRLAAARYPSRRHGGEPNRSQLILDALTVYAENLDETTVNNSCTGSTHDVEADLQVLVDEKLAPIQEKLATLELALGESNA